MRKKKQVFAPPVVMCCGACRFFEADESNPAKPMQEGSGLCRRYPPVVVGAMPETALPDVDSNDWCGEFQQPIN